MATYSFKYQLPESFFCQKTKFTNMVHCTQLDAFNKMKFKAKLM